jgi:hypothetical protein
MECAAFLQKMLLTILIYARQYVAAVANSCHVVSRYLFIDSLIRSDINTVLHYWLRQKSAGYLGEEMMRDARLLALSLSH